MASFIPQLFNSSFVDGLYRVVVTPDNEKILTAIGSGDGWLANYEAAAPGSAFTHPINLFASSLSIGVVYVKPMGVFTDGLCFSSCDMFSAGIQDNKLGLIFGADLKTGAGGGLMTTVCCEMP